MSLLVNTPWRIPNPLSPNNISDRTLILRILFMPLNEGFILPLLLIIVAITFIIMGILMLKKSLEKQMINI